MKSPNIDQNPVQAGRQTVQIVDNTQYSGFITASARGTSSGTTVLRADTSIATTASAGVQLGSGTLTDTAVVSGRVNPTAGGTVTFNLYGPGDPACAGPPIFSPAPVPYPIGGGPVTSPRVHADAGGDPSLGGELQRRREQRIRRPAPATTPARAPTSRRSPTTIATTASATVGLGAGTLTDTAVVSGRVNPQAGRDDHVRAVRRRRRDVRGRCRCSAPAPVPYPVAGGPVTSPRVHADAGGHVQVDRELQRRREQRAADRRVQRRRRDDDRQRRTADDRDDGIGERSRSAPGR